MRNALRVFFEYWWILWFLMLVVGDPIAVWLGKRNHVGDSYTDTHFIATHISMGLRVAILAWLAYHILIAHQRG